MKAIRKTLRVRDIPPSWQIDLPDDPDAPVRVWIVPADVPGGTRPLTAFIGAGRGAFRTAEEADDHLRRLRDAWDT